MAEDGMVDPMPANWILPEVREEKYWWGGHIWEDNLKTKRFSTRSSPMPAPAAFGTTPRS
jgi:hypothetical protein